MIDGTSVWWFIVGLLLFFAMWHIVISDDRDCLVAFCAALAIPEKTQRIRGNISNQCQYPTTAICLHAGYRLRMSRF